MRIQPHELDIPEANPFKHDLLNRQELAEILTHTLQSIEGPSVLAVDAPWGAGKTTFLKMWAQYLHNRGTPTVEFNAWETDFADNVLVALLTELTDQLDKTIQLHPNRDLVQDLLSRLRNLAGRIIRQSVANAVRVASSGFLDPNWLADDAVDGSASYVDERIRSYRDTKASLNDFREMLRKIAAQMAGATSSGPLVIIVDELDRCRPSYAIELLEIAKHMFAVDGVAFVLGINRNELAHSVKSIYGDRFDAVRYLERFIDLDFRLPDRSRCILIDDLLTRMDIREQFGDVDEDPTYEMLKLFLGESSSLSVREVIRLIHRLSLLYASLPDEKIHHKPATVALLILRTIDAALYRRFIRGEISDSEALDRVFAQMWPGTERHDLEFPIASAWFESLMIVGAQEFSYDEDPIPITSPLLERYRKVLHPSSEAVVDKAHLEHARRVVGDVEAMWQDMHEGEFMIGFSHSIQWIELLSSELFDVRQDALVPWKRPL